MPDTPAGWVRHTQHNHWERRDKEALLVVLREISGRWRYVVHRLGRRPIRDTEDGPVSAMEAADLKLAALRSL